jgi:hypothetical protein
MGLAFATIVLIAGVAGYLLDIWNNKRPHTSITADNGAMIKEGMTLADVEGILGGPARDESSGPLEASEREALEGQDLQAVARFFRRLGTDTNNTRLWVSDRAIILVNVFPDGRVSPGGCLPVRRVDTEPLAWIRRQINR